MKRAFSFALLITAGALAAAAGTPRIQFETNFFDFGKAVAVETVSGVFKFRNVGDGILKVDEPVPSCGCTDAKVKPDTLAPGESGEVTYKINLEHVREKTQKFINVHSNDPKTPDVRLTAQLSYTPIYEYSANALRIVLSATHNETQESFTITRPDGKPLGIDRLTTTQEWISAAFDPSFKPEDSSAQVNVTVHRPPRAFSRADDYVKIWNTHLASGPLRNIRVTAQFQGELSATPRGIYWILQDRGKDTRDYPAGDLTRSVELKSILGNPVQIKKTTSNIPGASVKIVPKEADKTFDLVLNLHKVPRQFTRGEIIIETTAASLPALEVPVTISLYQP